MSNSKISALTAATTPLAGTEVLPVVQSSATTKVTVANLTAGRAVSASSLTLTTALAATSGGTGSTSAFVANAIPYASSTTALSTSANLTYNGTDFYVAGGLGVGTTSLTGFNLRVGKTLTGAVTSYSVTSESTIQSDVTNAGISFLSSPSTQATSFTLAQIQHFRAAQGTIGATSAVTNQYGFVAASSLSGATNNFGFYGDIAAATNRWNLYMNGTAGNYLAGGLNVGAATNPGAGNISLTGNVVIGTSGKGIDFSATAGTGTSELFADYEEGTWTPTLASSSGTITSIASTSGVYTKCGNLVTVTGQGKITLNGTGAGAIKVTNLPYTAASAMARYAGGGAEVDIVGFGLLVFLLQSSNTIYLEKVDGTYPGGNGYNLIFNTTYQV